MKDINMKPKYYLPVIGGVIVLIAVYFLFFKGNSEIEKAIKSLNAQNYDMAVSNLKELLYDDEENIEAKSLLLYAQVRKSFEEQNIKTFDKAFRISVPNFVVMKNLIYQNKLNKEGSLKQKERERFLETSKNLRKQLSEQGIVTNDLDELESLLKNLCKLGSENFKIAQGDEVDQALYAFILAGNAFFGNSESGVNLMKIAKLNNDAIPLLSLCGETIVDELKEELKNDETLFGDISKLLVIKHLVQEEVKSFFKQNNKIQSAKDNISEKNSRLSSNLWVQYQNNQIFFDENIFPSYLEILQSNSKAGIDIGVFLYNNNNIISFYFYNPIKKQYVTKFYSFLNNNLSSINFRENGKSKSEFFNEENPIRFLSYNQDKSELTVATDKTIKKTGYRTEQRYNPQKYYNQYFRSYTGGYDYVNVPYEYEDISYTSKTYNLNKDKADFISEYNFEDEQYDGEGD